MYDQIESIIDTNRYRVTPTYSPIILKLLRQGEFMSRELEIALSVLWDVLKKEGHYSNCVAVDIRFTAEDYWVNYENRTAESLKRDCVSMRNICGEFIK